METKKISLFAAALLLSAAAFGQTKWNVDKAHAKIGFTVTHMMLSDVDGNFKKFDATLVSSKPDFTDAVFNIIIDVSSINTDNDMRDNDLRSSHYFDAAKYPQITFNSRGMTKTGDNTYKVTGNVTMHGVTKPITLDLIIKGTGTSMMTHKPVVGFKVSGTLNRTDFGVGSVPAAMVGDKVELRANGEFDQE